jgi:hypothetical protein
LGCLLIDKPLCLFSLLPHYCLLISLLTLSRLELHRLVGLDRTCSMSGKLGSMALDLKVLLLGCRSETALLMLGILVDLVLKLMRLVCDLLQRKLCTTEERQE